MWRFFTCRRFPVSSEKVPVQDLHKYGHFTSLCYKKKPVSFKSRKPKAYMLQAGVYACN